MSPPPSADWLRQLTRDWPGVQESIKWQQDLVFDVAGKMFAVTALAGRHGGCYSFKVPDALFLALTEQPGIAPAPYAARYKWVLLTEPERYGPDWLAEQIRQSYQLVAAKLPKATRLKLGLHGG